MSNSAPGDIESREVTPQIPKPLCECGRTAMEFVDACRTRIPVADRSNQCLSQLRRHAVPCWRHELIPVANGRSLTTSHSPQIRSNRVDTVLFPDHRVRQVTGWGNEINNEYECETNGYV